LPDRHDKSRAPDEGETLSPPFQGRILVGGLRGSSGKTATTLGLIGAWKQKGVPVTAFKKGPDYIDAAWHTVATGKPCYCLDVYMMGETKVARQFARKMPETGMAVIEGNRGLFDGFDIKGSFSTAELAKLLSTPVLLVVDATKMTRTAAAIVLGCMKMDPDLEIGGIVLNRVAGPRHRQIATDSIEKETGIPVMGAIPKLKKVSAPERHLGLVTPEETPEADKWLREMAEEIAPYLDLDRIEELAAKAPPYVADKGRVEPDYKASEKVRIGVIRDSAFPFYYPENLEAMERAGAELVWVSSVEDHDLPCVDALYLGGGFPETHARTLSGNESFRRSIREAADEGLPIYAECGGSVYLGRKLYYGGEVYDMAGVLPVDFEFCMRPQGHGYTRWKADRDNPFYGKGYEVRGHEFHYTRARDLDIKSVETVVNVERGVGFGDGREGIRVNNVVAFYGHVHALGTPEWAVGLVRAAERHRDC